MGKKYIVEIGRLERLYKASVNANGKPNMTWLSPEIDMTPYTEPDLEQIRKEAYEKGQKDLRESCVPQDEEAYGIGYNEGFQCGIDVTWDAARKIENLPEAEKFEIFGEYDMFHIMRRYTATEAIEKIRQYEQEQDAEIKVGDEVTPRETEYDDMIVTRLWKDDYDSDCIDAIGFDGRIGSFLVSRVSKTGKHYEISEVLRKMRESE